MRTSTIVWIIIIIVIILGGAWWYFSTNPMTPAPASTTTTTTGTTNGTPVVLVGTNATLGPVLVAANGMTLYTYSKDTVGVSNCTGACLTQWPAYSVASGTPLVGGPGLTAVLGAITRTDDGATQLTYNGLPLYFFAGDTAVGQTNGQNQGGFTVIAP